MDLKHVPKCIDNFDDCRLLFRVRRCCIYRWMEIGFESLNEFRQIHQSKTISDFQLVVNLTVSFERKKSCFTLEDEAKKKIFSKWKKKRCNNDQFLLFFFSFQNFIRKLYWILTKSCILVKMRQSVREHSPVVVVLGERKFHAKNGNCHKWKHWLPKS